MEQNNKFTVLKKHFTSSENANYIVHNVLNNIAHMGGPVIDRNDSTFFQCFNTVATKVFNVESKRLIGLPIKDIIIAINNTVIKELTDYTASKYEINDLFKTEDLTIKKSPQHNTSKVDDISSKKNVIATDEPVVIQVKESKFKLLLDTESNVFDTPIRDVNNIKLLKLQMYNEDYIINETNNKFEFREIEFKADKELYSKVKTVELICGNYTPSSLTGELEEQLNKQNTSAVFTISIDDINNKTTLSVDFKSELDSDTKNLYTPDKKLDIISGSSTLLQVLGFQKDDVIYFSESITSSLPIKVIKRSSVTITVFVNEVRFESFPIILDKKDHVYDVDISKSFKNPIEINSIDINFGDYNHRGYPYNLLLEITQKGI